MTANLFLKRLTRNNITGVYSEKHSFTFSLPPTQNKLECLCLESFFMLA
jgi:hypothetical protein